jgi:hypothetical protein
MILDQTFELNGKLHSIGFLLWKGPATVVVAGPFCLTIPFLRV